MSTVLVGRAIHSKPRIVPKHSLRFYWWLLVCGFVVGGIYEVIDNMLGLRQLNFESSAPIIFKIAKEVAISLLIISAIRQWGGPRATGFGLGALFIILIAFVSQLFIGPLQPHALAGLIYFSSSALMLLLTCAVIRPEMKQDFVSHFLVPALVITFITQVLEAQFAPSSMYFETNLLGLDRRAGIAVIPTTAGMLGVVGAATSNRLAILFGLLVIGMANSTLSLLCLAITLAAKVRRRIYILPLLPLIMAAAILAITSRSGLELSVSTRLEIFSDTLAQLSWFTPSLTGAFATAKSVALAPFDSTIVDSFYLEVLHVFGAIPGFVFLGALFATIYRRAGGLALMLFAATGIGYLVLEAWIVWIAILFGVPNRSSRNKRIAGSVRN